MVVSRSAFSRQFLHAVIIFCLIAAGLLISGTVLAAPPPTPINTNDGAVDPQWNAPIYTSTANRSDVTDTLEIEQAWIMSDDKQMYFRIQTYEPAALISGYGVVAAIDCNQDGVTNTRADRLITWEISNDALAYRYGDTFEAVGLYCIVGFPCPYGERANNPANDNVEWRGDYSAIPLDSEAFPADCRDDISISLAIANMTTTTTTDYTPLFPWNVPTNVEVEKIQASSQPTFTAPALWGISLALVAAFGVVLIYRRRLK